MNPTIANRILYKHDEFEDRQLSKPAQKGSQRDWVYKPRINPETGLQHCNRSLGG
jgi:hypothetical protein